MIVFIREEKYLAWNQLPTSQDSNTFSIIL